MLLAGFSVLIWSFGEVRCVSGVFNIKLEFWEGWVC